VPLQKLDLSASEASLAALGRLPLEGDVDDVHRDAAIQRFEFTYDVRRQLMRRNLMSAGVRHTELMGRLEFFGEALRHGLIKDVSHWTAYEDARIATAHNYDEAHAWSVFARIAAFHQDAPHLLTRLREHHA
jgi:nucleotidyltransferase substrate binding protein (TIGR01987 family)